MIYVFLICYIPMLITQLSVVSIPAGLFLGLVSVFCLYQKRKSLPISDKILAAELIAFPVLCGLYLLLGFSDDGFRYAGQTAIFSIGALSALAVFHYFHTPQRTKLFLGILAVFILYIIAMSFIGNAALQDNDTNLANHITGAPYCNAIMIFSGIFLILSLQAKRRAAKLLLLLASLLCFAVITIILQRAINAILCLFMLALLLIMSSRYRKIILVACALLILLVFLTGAIPAIIKSVAALNPGDRLANRLRSLAELMVTGNMSVLSKSILLRFSFLQNSINTWLSDWSTFLIGYGSHTKDYSVISGHSDILDTFAKYGIVGGLLLLDILRRGIVFIMRKQNRQQKIYSAVIVLFVILWGILGAIFRAYTSVALFVALPASAGYALSLQTVRDKTGALYRFMRGLLTGNMFRVAERDIRTSSRLVAGKRKRRNK
ncbi:MAG: hypothetical protein ILO36_01705 [Abditibacteriota bacterium]|nr:hypothetical protein [Abditibacteriota bacterium]